MKGGGVERIRRRNEKCENQALKIFAYPNFVYPNRLFPPPSEKNIFYETSPPLKKAQGYTNVTANQNLTLHNVIIKKL